MSVVHCSSLSRVMRCMASFAVRAEDEGSGSDAAAFGLAFHEVMETITKRNVVVWSGIKTKYGLSDDEITDLSSLSFVPKFNDDDWTVDVEQSFVIGMGATGCPMLVENEAHPKALLAGRLDRRMVHVVQNVAQVVDYKSGFKVVTDDWQGIGYAIGTLAQMPSLEAIHPVYVYPRLRRLVQRMAKDGTPQPYTRDELLSLWSYVAKRCEQALLIRDSGSISAKNCQTGAQCEWCAVHLCPAHKKFLASVLNGTKLEQPEATASRAEWEKWGREIFPRWRIYQKLAKEIEGALKSLADVTPVPLGGGEEYARVSSMQEKVDAGEAFAVLRKFCGDDLDKLGKAIGMLPKDFVYDFTKIAFANPRGKAAELLELLRGIKAIKEIPMTRYTVCKSEDAEKKEEK